jgi:hypothetical protein
MGILDGAGLSCPVLAKPDRAGNMDKPYLTERQRQWFASVRANLEQDTGRSIEEWVAIARQCPETGVRARLKWLKDHHGLAQNRAMTVLREAFGTKQGWDRPEALITALWRREADRAIFEAVRSQALTLADVVMGARKGYTAFSRRVQFCALRPVKDGVRLGLAVGPQQGSRLAPRGRSESGSDRLTASLSLAQPQDVDDDVRTWLIRAWEAS